jgi:hypothetical protein
MKFEQCPEFEIAKSSSKTLILSVHVCLARSCQTLFFVKAYNFNLKIAY